MFVFTQTKNLKSKLRSMYDKQAVSHNYDITEQKKEEIFVCLKFHFFKIRYRGY